MINLSLKNLAWDLRVAELTPVIISVADEIGIFLILSQTPSSLDDISSITGLPFNSIKSFMDILLCMNLIKQSGTKLILHPEQKASLTPGSQLYIGKSLIKYKSSLEQQLMIEGLKSTRGSLKMGGKNRDDLWLKSDATTEQSRWISESMETLMASVHSELAKAETFDTISSVLDIGGGSGSFIRKIRAEHTHLRTGVFELPSMCKILSPQRNFETFEGNFMKDAIPQGFDALILSNILHDWNLEDCQIILKNARSALGDHGKIFIVESLTDDCLLGTAVMDLVMRYQFGAQQFSGRELDNLLQSSGFKSAQKVSDSGYFTLLVADVEL